MWSTGLVELGHPGPLPTLEHLGGVADRTVGVAFHQHHLVAGAAGGQGGGQARHPATQHDQLHGVTPTVQATGQAAAASAATDPPTRAGS